MSEETIKLISLNVLRAETTLDDAKFLVENQKYHIAVNRIYYSAFYIISAFAIRDGFESSKHQQLIGWFNKNYVANERVNKE
ncbi:MAG TPA: HEPN domain-containing protein [Spirochaetota bacterium]|nr:HEPN domain-containing protein [Spirochaetota bacterium]HQB60147.1 HEPN domain-containing protein [Spirochaetota bacterium]